MTREAIAALCWPAAGLADAVEAVATRAGLVTGRGVERIAPAPRGDRDRDLGRWLAEAARAIGLEVEPVETPYAEVEPMLRQVGPAVLRIADRGGDGYLALLPGGRSSLRVLAPDLRVHRLPIEVVRTALCKDVEDARAAAIDDLVRRAGVPRRRVAPVRSLLLRELLSARRVGGVWLIRLPPGARFIDQARAAGVRRPLTRLVLAHVVRIALFLLAWRTLGEYALGGESSRAWLAAWVLLLVSQAPLQVALLAAQGHLSIALGGLLRQRLLAGALALAPEEIRAQGSGQLLGQVIEAEELQALSLSGGFTGLFAAIELVAAAAVLAVGSGGVRSVVALLAVIAVTAVTLAGYVAARERAAHRRSDLTHEVVEGIVGHRTRVAQAPPGDWHQREDARLARYLTATREADRRGVVLRTVIPRAWLLLGLLAIAPAVGSGAAPVEAVAIALGGTLLAQRALARLGEGAISLAGALIAWRSVRTLFRAATRQDQPGTHRLDDAAARPREDGDPPLLEARDLGFRYPGRSTPVLCELVLEIHRGDRVLIEGPSGGGKSTLVSLLGGLRRSDAGMLLMRGLDRDVLGDRGWREQIAIAPQFHENHVLTATLAFNLLMGRGWPPTRETLEEAESACRELGLGELLDRMPAGLEQMVGEGGWQLSHGEKSRLYVARALLQRSPLIVLDESLAALDPETLDRALRYILSRDLTVVVIAHP